MLSWQSIVLAAWQTLATLSPSLVALFHGGAGHTADKVNSAIQVLNLYGQGLASTLTQHSIHPDLAAHAAVVESNHAAVTAAGA